MASGKASLHARSEGPLRIPLQLVLDPRSSTGAEARTSGFLSSDDMDLGDPLEFPQKSQAWSYVETCKSAFFSSCKCSVSHPFDLTNGSVAFSRGATGLSHLPSRFKLILGMTVESVQGNQLYLEWIGILGYFGIVSRPLEFLSSFKMRPPLEV